MNLEEDHSCHPAAGAITVHFYRPTEGDEGRVLQEGKVEETQNVRDSLRNNSAAFANQTDGLIAFVLVEGDAGKEGDGPRDETVLGGAALARNEDGDNGGVSIAAITFTTIGAVLLVVVLALFLARKRKEREVKTSVKELDHLDEDDLRSGPLAMKDANALDIDGKPIDISVTFNNGEETDSTSTASSTHPIEMPHEVIRTRAFAHILTEDGASQAYTSLDDGREDKGDDVFDNLSSDEEDENSAQKVPPPRMAHIPPDPMGSIDLRNETHDALDVHACQSATCALCRQKETSGSRIKSMEPTFMDVESIIGSSASESTTVDVNNVTDRSHVDAANVTPTNVADSGAANTTDFLLAAVKLSRTKNVGQPPAVRVSTEDSKRQYSTEDTVDL